MTTATTSAPPPVPPALKLLRLKFRLLAAVSTTAAFQSAWRLFTTPRRLPVKAWEAAALAEASRFEVAFGQGQLVAYEWNPAGACTVLLVHGWEHRASFWGALAQGLAAAGYRVVAFDGPAHGASSGRRTTLPLFGAAIQAVADAVGPIWGVVAHSFGAAATAGLPVYFNGGQLLPRLVLLSVPGSTPAVFGRFAELLQLPAKVAARLVEFAEARHGRTAESYSLTQVGHQVPAERALLLHDRADETIPFQEAEAIARSWPGLDFRPTQGLGHNRIMRDPTVLQQVVEFLGEG
ncbi:alpha/beta fold hydrolase [Hymenobacter chitinivorans]|uniref:Pimeloyl-ACP methyl ester carboxylesterase n=1 Tax=Hymenobacter chitinivorans DSM 11115 TaxID=1121954 RepID=A0A2M9BST3_9BACT|nr:alpha/beta hydrolase [Hymenobacter chitinivorans]PJJ60993.1 pimeloyl-ACP methyl ester carboxylesterase [Hymenobacter chitinivorans DSM 11115]